MLRLQVRLDHLPLKEQAAAKREAEFLRQLVHPNIVAYVCLRAYLCVLFAVGCTRMCAATCGLTTPPYCCVRYVESFVESGMLHIVMGYADGGDVDQRIQRAKKWDASQRGVMLCWIFAPDVLHVLRRARLIADASERRREGRAFSEDEIMNYFVQVRVCVYVCWLAAFSGACARENMCVAGSRYLCATTRAIHRFVWH